MVPVDIKYASPPRTVIPDTTMSYLFGGWICHAHRNCDREFQWPVPTALHCSREYTERLLLLGDCPEATSRIACNSLVQGAARHTPESTS